MARVRMRVQMSGTRNDEAWPPPGATLDLGRDEAYELQRAGIVDLIADDDIDHIAPQVHEPTGRPVETASLEEDVETASTDTGGTGRRSAKARKGRADTANPVVSSTVEETPEQTFTSHPEAVPGETEPAKGIQPGRF
jgi:hypothetical protein